MLPVFKEVTIIGNKLKIYNSEYIMTTPLEKQEYIIYKMLYPGLYILAGAPKIAPMSARPYQVYLTLAIYSGFRRSEMLGLEWKDIDFNYKTIKIRRTSQYTAEKGIYTDTTKTKKSQRISKFPETVMELLKRFQQEQSKEANRLGSKWEEHDRLFTKWNGAPMHPQTPYKWLRDYCEKINIPFRGLHTLRHLHASLLIYEGMDVVAVSADMGHSVVGTTLNLYSHMFQEARARNCEAITKALSFTNEVSTEEKSSDVTESSNENEDEQEEESLGLTIG